MAGPATVLGRPAIRPLACALAIVSALVGCGGPQTETPPPADSGGASHSSAGSLTTTFTEDIRPFANPERGFFHGRGRTQEQPPSDAWPGLNKSAVPGWRDTE